ncbi:RNA 2'-phosphotransferase [Paenibacillus sp. S150]|uniref:RNA 2'-phosphotransferase n=1 Tax=Paenibacillus sp. S150 TaxID=2749826 RepID=UPI001C55CF97|nr:RNA 2'-phosphotransferase [Paenibacillus sp. S150]MBW4084384.1 RNA 2'-phosphotransferase [Paenibacillus sp. S150]
MLNQAAEASLSKFMTKLLRHTPAEYGLPLDPEDGSCLLKDLLSIVTADPKWTGITQADIRQVVGNSGKQRFAIQEERIRARYGHSHAKLTYEPGTPPPVLYHGTHQAALPAILKEGLQPTGRQYVHLSAGLHFAGLAGSRRGKLVLLTVDTVKAAQMGVTCYYAGNEVWLAEPLPPACIALREEQ